MPKETGGPAFPQPFAGHCGNEDHSNPCGCYLDTGMTLRDWFAGMALQGLLANPENANSYVQCASDAYLAADKALVAREEK